MKIAVIYNRVSLKVINLLGVPNREKYGHKAITRIVNCLKQGGHQVISLEGDKDLIDNLEDFMPQVLKGERPGMVFNLAYGIQGQARYTHVPGMLEMVGIPYVGSGPLAHSLALDKVVAKMLFKQNGLPTPDFAVLDSPNSDLPDLQFPLIVKPKNEAVSYGIKIVNNEEELRAAAKIIFDKFDQSVLVEQYIEGREINVGVIGNSPGEAFAPAELIFGAGGPAIYTYEDKTRKSGREVGISCPAKLSDQLTEHAKDIAIKAFNALGCLDCARIDMRLDAEDNLYILEINSLPSLGEHGSYVAAAETMGMDFTALVNRLVDVAATRYFGTPSPPELSQKKISPPHKVFSFLTQKRDQLEYRLRKWSQFSCRTMDMVDRQLVVKEIDRRLQEIRMKPVPSLTNDKVAWTWESQKGLKNGTLLVLQLDVPFDRTMQHQGFRKDPEWFYGEGLGAVWAPLTVLEFTLRALRSCRKLKNIPLGVICYADEGLDCRDSSTLLQEAIAQAGEVIVLRPGNPEGNAVLERRGQTKYLLKAEGRPMRLGKPSPSSPETLRWVMQKVEQLTDLTVKKDRVAVAATEIQTDSFPMLLPHRVQVTLMTSYPTQKAGNELDEKIKQTLGKANIKWNLEMFSNRPPMRTKKRKNALVDGLKEVATTWDIPFGVESSMWPSVAGLASQGKSVICGMGPVVRDLYTAREAVERISIIQRTLLLSEYLLQKGDLKK
ncbi:MAG: ATP-grasp domain-containing protein [Desulfobulbaceae bacterium]|nr:ATP-grasp domain-containing protein [Desulfobulbaceae bacterium]